MPELPPLVQDQRQDGAIYHHMLPELRAGNGAVAVNYSGSDWIKNNYKYYHPDAVISDLGCDVADLLGELFFGIYHIDNRALMKVDWTNKYYIEISVGWQDWSTIDFDKLTRLVFLAHHTAIRINMTPTKYGYMKLLFHQRDRTGDLYQRHPTLDEAVQKFKETVSIPEYSE